MNMERKICRRDIKRGFLLRRLVWIMLGVLLYVLTSKFLYDWIENTCGLTAYNFILDVSMIFVVRQFLQAIIILVTTINDKRDDFDSRFKIYFMEFIAIGAFIYFIYFNWNQSHLWIDILIFVLSFVRFLIYNNSYINSLKYADLCIIANCVRRDFQERYDEAVFEVEQFNLKEQKLAEIRAKYAESDREVDKAYKDQRSYTVDSKKNPDNHSFPIEPGYKNYTGIRGLFFGRSCINDYQYEVGKYIASLQKAFKNEDKRSRELQARITDIDDAIRYVEGTEDEHKIEEILGKEINRSEKARNSYQKLYRRRFERKNRKY